MRNEYNDNDNDNNDNDNEQTNNIHRWPGVCRMDWWPSIRVQVAMSRSNIAVIVDNSFEYSAPPSRSKFGAVEFGLEKALNLISMNDALEDHMIIIETDAL